MAREGTAVTCDGRLFHRRAAATGNALSPTVDRRVRRTCRVVVDGAEVAEHTVVVVWIQCLLLWETLIHHEMVAEYTAINNASHKEKLELNLTKFLRRRSICMLGNTRSNCSPHTSTTCVSVVLNNFTKKRLTTKSREANCDLFRGSASSPWL